MCLHTKLMRNPKYIPNKKNNGKPPKCDDERKLYVPVSCGNCIECRKKKQREWQVRLGNEIENDKTGKFITLTFSEKALNELTKGRMMDANEVATIAVRKFLERWRKKYKKSVKHWFITELGHTGTERIHLHGIIFTDKTEEEIIDRWQYGRIHIGYECSMKTVNYLIKYVTKTDNDHKGFKGKILPSPGIGKNYLSKWDAKNNKYAGEKTKEWIKLPNGAKTAMPTYYRNKIYTEEEREKLWIEKLEKGITYVMGQKIRNANTKEGEKEYWEAIKHARKISIELGFGDGTRKKKQFMQKNGKIIWK